MTTFLWDGKRFCFGHEPAKHSIICWTRLKSIQIDSILGSVTVITAAVVVAVTLLVAAAVVVVLFEPFQKGLNGRHPKEGLFWIVLSRAAFVPALGGPGQDGVLAEDLLVVQGLEDKPKGRSRSELLGNLRRGLPSIERFRVAPGGRRRLLLMRLLLVDQSRVLEGLYHRQFFLDAPAELLQHSGPELVELGLEERDELSVAHRRGNLHLAQERQEASACTIAVGGVLRELEGIELD
mmetsp:Transcript_17929/g.49660  ORF Transcript_17929/g.49660 Transcript_17929/m.49660 type:complete len:237 (+) Transcript_17929:170-880(+)